MKRLFLVRHAKSSWKLDYLDDFERPLNKRGKREAPLMAGVLRDLGVKPSVILTSPAARAVSTARIIASEIGYPFEGIRYEEHLYDAGVRDFVEAIGRLNDSYDSAMMVSHDPGVTLAANRLTGSSIDGIPTGGIVAIDFEIESWHDLKEGSGKEVFFEYPKKYRTEVDAEDGGESEREE